MIVKKLCNCTLYNSDCLEMLKEVADNSIDLVVTSPPYNLKIEYDTWDDNMSWDDYYYWCRKWFNEVYRVLKPDGRFCLNHYFSCGSGANKHYPLMKFNSICVEELGFKHHSLAIWSDTSINKLTAWGSWLSASAPFVSEPYEGILILYKETWKKMTSGESTISKEDFMMGCSGVWKIGTDGDSLTIATYPVRLPKLCIDLFTYKGDTVLDPFSGSGSTAVATIYTDRKFIGSEISEKYYNISVKRIEKVLYDVSMPLFDFASTKVE